MANFQPLTITSTVAAVVLILETKYTRPMVVSNLPQEEKQFRLLGHEDVLKEIENNAYANCWEVKEVYYRICASRE